MKYDKELLNEMCYNHHFVYKRKMISHLNTIYYSLGCKDDLGILQMQLYLAVIRGCFTLDNLMDIVKYLVSHNINLEITYIIRLANPLFNKGCRADQIGVTLVKYLKTN